MNISEVDIINLGLGMVGAADIGALTDRSTEAAAARKYWPVVREAVFAASPWHCLEKRVTLSTTTTEPAWGYAYAYPLPDDFVRIIRLELGGAEYEVVNQRVLQTDLSADVEIAYVSRETDTTRYSGALIRCLYLNLAYEFAHAVVRNRDTAAMILDHLQKFFRPVCLMADAAGSGHQTLAAEDLVDRFDY